MRSKNQLPKLTQKRMNNEGKKLSGYFLVTEHIEWDSILVSGDVVCFKNGVLHCDNGPALINDDDTRMRYIKNGILHRIDGPALMTFNDQQTYSFKDGKIVLSEKTLLNYHPINSGFFLEGDEYQEDIWTKKVEIYLKHKLKTRLEKEFGTSK